MPAVATDGQRDPAHVYNSVYRELLLTVSPEIRCEATLCRHWVEYTCKLKGIVIIKHEVEQPNYGLYQRDAQCSNYEDRKKGEP